MGASPFASGMLLIPVLGAVLAGLIGILWWVLRVPQSKVVSSPDTTNLTKEGFATRKIPKDIDVIVIGSGMGGLTFAAVMAKEGKRVLVLEQHDVAGGTTHTFDEEGFEFDTGLHYIGSVGSRRSPTRRQFDYVTDGKLEWARMDEEYDVAIVHNADGTRDRVPIHASRVELLKRLKAEFPNEHAAIDEFFRLSRTSQKIALPVLVLPLFLPTLARICQFFMSGHIKKLVGTTKAVLARLTTNERLKGVLAYIYGDYGEPPSRGSFLMNSLLWEHFNRGAYYPVGGSARIAECIVPVIRRTGGNVLVRAPVSTILVSADGKAQGVVVKGTPIYAPIVVSGVGAPKTFTTLIPDEHKFRVEGIMKTMQMPEHASDVTLMSLFVGIEGDAQDLGLKSQNYWIFPSWDHDANWSTFEKDSLNIPGVFVSFSSVKDPSYAERHPGKQVALVICPGLYRDFEKYQNERVKHRGVEYNALKQQYQEVLMKILLREFPQLEGKIKYTDMGTAVTNDYYLGTYRGAVYGLAHTPERYKIDEMVQIATPIKNLYLTGQDLVSCGVVGAMVGGYLTAFAVHKPCIFRIGGLF
eukprot:c15556_g1_i1.p1 GENE.c15556_g1_i1~~c15556_g1_i1.p1  ORF type:complete len:582 (-),score=114.16 c15556_g1_i1:924-2669(-)